VSCAKKTTEPIEMPFGLWALITVIYNLGHWLHILTAVHKSIQPSTYQDHLSGDGKTSIIFWAV